MKKNTSGTSGEGGQNPVVTPTKPPDREHELSRDCWCQPIVDGTAPDEVPLEELIEHQRSIYDGYVSIFGTESHWTVLSGSILASLLELQDRRAALQSAPDQDKVVVPNSMPLPSAESVLEEIMVMPDSEVDKCEAVWGMGDIDRGIQNMAAEIARLRAAKEQS